MPEDEMMPDAEQQPSSSAGTAGSSASQADGNKVAARANERRLSHRLLSSPSSS